MNYGEELAYWYLRFNGFFPITNFVAHGIAPKGNASDCDVLAIRMPYVFENIGGRYADWDRDLLANLNLTEFNTAVICEVKSGETFKPEDAFTASKLHYCLERTGLIAPTDVEAVFEQFRRTQTVVHGNSQVAKLLIAHADRSNGLSLFKSIDGVRHFLQERVTKYPKEKFRDRLFFDSNLIQDLIDRTARPQ